MASAIYQQKNLEPLLILSFCSPHAYTENQTRIQNFQEFVNQRDFFVSTTNKQDSDDGSKIRENSELVFRENMW